MKEKPVIVQELQSLYEQKKSGLKALEEKFKTILLARKDKELELKSKEDEIAKANIQLSQIKTNKEYTAKLTEIETLKANKSITEEKILISYDESDAVSAKVEQEKKILADEEKRYFVKKK